MIGFFSYCSFFPLHVTTFYTTAKCVLLFLPEGFSIGSIAINSGGPETGPLETYSRLLQR